MASIVTTFGFKDQISQSLTMLNRTLEELNRTLKNVKGGSTEASQGLDKLGGKAGGVSTKLLNFNMATQAFRAVKGAVDSVTRSMGEMSAAYNFQIEQETKLETVMKNHMKASAAQIQSVKDYASNLQKSGIYGDEMILQGAQELATYVEDPEVLKQLMPTLNSMLAQGVGMNATSRDMQSYATMLGKVMQGQVGGMSKRGYKFTEAEEEILKTGTELQKLQVLQNNVLGNFGDMNKALAQTPQGQIIQLNNNLGDLKEQVGKALIPYQQLFSISTMNWKIRWYETLIKALNFLTENINKVVIALAALGTAAVAIGVYFAILHKQEIAAAIAAAAHWLATHAAMLLTIGVIVAVIAAIAALLMFSEKTFPAIGGFIGGIAEIAKVVGNNLRYYFGTAIEFIVNGFLKMKDRVADFFLGMLEIVVAGIAKVAPLIDKVLKTNVSESVSGFQANLKAMKEQTPEEFKLGWTGEQRSLKDAWSIGSYAGREKGAQLSDKMQGWLDDKLSGVKNIMGSTEAAMPSTPAIEGLDFQTDSSGALVTADKNVLELSDEYKTLLSEQARKKFNLSFTQMTPKVDFGDVNINNMSDSESVLQMLAEGLEEVASSSLRSA